MPLSHFRQNVAYVVLSFKRRYEHIGTIAVYMFVWHLAKVCRGVWNSIGLRHYLELGLKA